MTRLAEAIRRSQRIESAPMGFGAARPAAKPTMLVGGLVKVGGVQAAASAGADFIVVDARGAVLSPADAGKAREAAGQLPLGAVASVADSAAATALREAGVDFLLVNPDTPAAALLDDELGYILALPNKPEEQLLRALEPLTLEAIYLSELPSPLTLAGEMDLARVAALGRKPVICQAPSGASRDDLLCLRTAGVVGVLTAGDGVSNLKETVVSLPPRRPRREERTVVSLPRGKATAHEHDDDDDD